MTAPTKTAVADPHTDRIDRIRHRYQSAPAVVSVERARLYTEHWRKTEGRDLPVNVRVAEAMLHVYRHQTHHVDPDDRICGHWTESFLGVPVDVERGVFNAVLAAELQKSTMVRYRAVSALRGLAYLVRKRSLAAFVRHQRTARATGTPPLDMGLQTMSERKVNPFEIDPDDRRVLLRDLLPYWKGRTLVDRLESELAGAGLLSPEMQDFATALPGNTSRQVLMLSACATIATMQGHVILDHERALRLGVHAMRAEAADARRLATDPGTEAFYSSIETALDGITVFAERLADSVAAERDATADPERRAELDEMAAICRKVPVAPPETFREAVQALWTVKTAVEVAHPVNLHCFGRLDQILNPYYEADLAAGRTTPATARELLEELLLKVMSQNLRPESNVLANFYHRFFGSTPVTIGGVTREGEDASNGLTYLFLDAADRSRAVTNMSVRVSEKTPDALLERVAEHLYDQSSNLSVYADEVNVEAMRRRGFAEADARDYALMGCVEATCPGKTGSMSANALLLSQLLDTTLHSGDARTMAGAIHGDGPDTGAAASFETFEDLLDAFFVQARSSVEKIVAGSNLRDRLFAEHLPAPVVSAFMDGCLAGGRDVTAGGATYDLSGISCINSIANLVDSLYAIKRLVFDEARFTLPEVVAAVDDNFAGHDEIAAAADGLPGKWGNGHPETDELARRVCARLFAEVCAHRTWRDGPFVVYVISMTTHTIGGRMSGATPDGRRAATPFAASCNPYNVESGGVTSALRSVAALPYEEVMGCAVNVKFHPTGIGVTPEARRKWVSLVRTYFALGGSQIQPTVAGAEMLRAAQADPDSHRDLIVKVGGYSTYFVDLGCEIQDEIIARTEHR